MTGKDTVNEPEIPKPKSTGVPGTILGLGEREGRSRLWRKGRRPRSTDEVGDGRKGDSVLDITELVGEGEGRRELWRERMAERRE